jgi:hypothetical protein
MAIEIQGSGLIGGNGVGILHVTGNPVPDCTGRYEYAGLHDSRPYYKHVSLDFWIWWYDTLPEYILSSLLGDANGWYQDISDIDPTAGGGYFFPGIHVTGDVYVTGIPTPPP